jgi:hypothetical protein
MSGLVHSVGDGAQPHIAGIAAMHGGGALKREAHF